MRPPGAAAKLHVAVVLCAVYAVFWIQFGAVRPENFGGIDEWMVLALARRGIAAVPHANRPFGLLFNLPAGLFHAHLLEAAWLFHGHYLAAAGLLTSLLLLRLAPARPEWALLAGTFAATWAPTDALRLNALYSSAYAGVAAISTLVVWLLSVSGGRPVPVVLAAALGFLATRVHEGCLPLLLIAPILLGLLGVRLPRGALALYYAVMALAVAAVAVPLLRGREETVYQREVLGVYLDVPGLVGRLGEQFRLELGPLFRPGPGLFGGRALASAAVLVAATLVVGRGAAREAPGTLAVWRGVLVGVLAAAAAFSAFILGARMTANAGRTQMLAGPWIGLALASLVVLAASPLRRRARLPVVALLGACVAAAGAARTLQLQEFFDRAGAYQRQASALRQVVAIAPDVQAGTLLVFVDGSRTWLGSFVFHYAVDLLYVGKAAGCVVEGRQEMFVTCSMAGSGVRQEPWPMLREPWGLAPRVFPASDIVVFASDAAGRVRLEDSWPEALTPLPPGAGYAPRSRAVPLAAVPPERSVLERDEAPAGR